MEISRDISNHLFYTAWVLLLLQMGKILGSAFLYDLLFIIIDIAFDCALILFAIGLIRAGRENTQITHWKITSFFIFSAAFIDILTIILSFLYLDDNWKLRPIMIARLVLLLIYLISLVIGFAYLKLLLDSMEHSNLINRSGRFLISAGFIFLFYPILIAWTSDWVFPQFIPTSLGNTALAIFLLASFVLILGFLELVFTLKILRDGFVKEEVLLIEEKDSVANDE
jgi:hypothetical protein